MSEEKKRPYDEEEELTPAQGKIIVIILTILFTIFLVVMIIHLDRWNARQIENDLRKAESEEQAELMDLDEIDKLCGERLSEYTENGVFDLEHFLYGYGFRATETGWVGDEGKLIFDFTQGDTPTLRFQVDDREYQRTLTNNPSKIDNVNTKIGAKQFVMGRDDVTAIGRVIMGETCDFELVD